MSVELPLLCSSDQLYTLLQQKNTVSDLLIVDLCSTDNFSQGHIANAIHVETCRLIDGNKPAPGKLPSLDSLNQLIADLGITPDTHVVVYDDQNSAWAGRFIWTLDLFGHQKVSLLDGGRAAWEADIGEFETESNDSTRKKGSEYQLKAYPKSLIADKDDIIEQLNRSGIENSIAIWDARSQAEYTGEKAISPRGGHIPGAISYDWTRLFDTERQNRLRPLDQIQQELNQLGISADKTVITHCQTHRRSGLTYFVAKLLGYKNIKAYPGSWSEWGTLEDTPIHTGLEP